MDTNSLILLIFSFVAGCAVIYFFMVKKNTPDPIQKQAVLHANSGQYQLQAYERLLLLANRIALPNLISRENVTGTTAREMQFILTQHIKEEFSHNITQQIYVSDAAWQAVKNLKEQNMLIINQTANALPAEASGMDLNKILLEYVMNDKMGLMHDTVCEVLSFEAKKIL